MPLVDVIFESDHCNIIIEVDKIVADEIISNITFAKAVFVTSDKCSPGLWRANFNDIQTASFMVNDVNIRPLCRDRNYFKNLYKLAITFQKELVNVKAKQFYENAQILKDFEIKYVELTNDMPPMTFSHVKNSGSIAP